MTKLDLAHKRKAEYYSANARLSTLTRESHTTGQQHQSGVRSAFLYLQKKKKKNSQVPRQLISDAQEWINEIPSVPIYPAFAGSLGK